MAVKKKRATKKKVIKPMTLNEFRAKLEGIEMFNADNWHPDKEQWDLIREMINQIVEEEVEEGVEYEPHPTAYRPMDQTPRGGTPASVHQEYSSSLMDTVAPARTTTPAIRTDLPPPANVDVSNARDSGLPISETPTIDTSDGKYESSFA